MFEPDWEALEAESQAVPAHENLGRLPRPIREMIWGELRCGQPRYDGKPCRHRVSKPGQTCAAHCTGNSCGKCRACYLQSDEYKHWLSTRSTNRWLVRRIGAARWVGGSNNGATSLEYDRR